MTEAEFNSILERCGFEPSLSMISRYMNNPLVHALMNIILQQQEEIGRYLNG